METAIHVKSAESFELRGRLDDFTYFPTIEAAISASEVIVFVVWNDDFNVFIL